MFTVKTVYQLVSAAVFSRCSSLIVCKYICVVTGRRGAARPVRVLIARQHAGCFSPPQCGGGCAPCTAVRPAPCLSSASLLQCTAACSHAPRLIVRKQCVSTRRRFRRLNTPAAVRMPCLIVLQNCLFVRPLPSHQQDVLPFFTVIKLRN